MHNVRIRDVANALGVSSATVSKILSGGPSATRFNAQTVERVRSMATDMGYVPNRVARNLRARRTHEVGITLGTAPPLLQAGPFDGQLLTGVTEAAGECGLAAVVVYPRTQARRVLNVSTYLDGRIDGLIVRCFDQQDLDLVYALANKRLPLVAIWRRDVPDGVGYVDADHHGGTYRAAQHLLKQGHRRIAFYTGRSLDAEYPHVRERRAGYAAALADMGFDAPSAWQVTSEREVVALLRAPNPVTAICAINDTEAGQLTNKLEVAGFSIPADVSLVGFDNLAGYEHLGGGLTTVDHPLRDMGKEAVRCLVALRDGAAPATCRTILPTPLIVRRSSVPPTTRS